MAVERLQKILSNAGVSSRRVAEELILSGRVAVNGEVLDTLGARADLATDEVTVDGVPVLKESYRYFVLNKPIGFISTASDEMDRETVLDLVPIGDIQLHPVGRLDRDSEGLLILTNDGHLTDLLTHPRYEVEKEYLVGIDSMPSQRDLERLVRGIESEGERLRAAAVRPAVAPPAAQGDESQGAAFWLVITLKEGRNREIRRMVEALGRQVLLLRRIRLGPLLLGDLGSGAFRELIPEEIDALYAAGKRAETAAQTPAAVHSSRFAPKSPGPPRPAGAPIRSGSTKPKGRPPRSGPPAPPTPRTRAGGPPSVSPSGPSGQRPRSAPAAAPSFRAAPPRARTNAPGPSSPKGTGRPARSTTPRPSGPKRPGPRKGGR
ncbi:MAG: pseudouridine synthase [Tepidiformaceae bacterium]